MNMLRKIPSVNELLDSPPLKNLVDRASRSTVVGGVRTFLADLRQEVQTATDLNVPTASELAELIAKWIQDEDQPVLRPVINATGILLHTGLARAPLASEALDAIAANGSAYTNLEVCLESGERSQRIQSVEGALQKLTGAEAAAVVNNNAAATLLALTALGAGREVIVSRGELIEIGGSYRLPDVMTASGAVLREVGTTNKTRIGDFQQAINQETGALLRVHTSNYVVTGFTESASLAELVALGRQRNLPVIDDIGSGALIDFSKYGIENEPVAADSIRQGADLVLFSGDKLLGGPQCGIIVGRKRLVDRIVKHPLMRAMRVDKLTLSALAATLRLYADVEMAEQQVPLLQLLSTATENLKLRAERLAPQMQAIDGVESAEPIEDHAFLGGGSVPTQKIPTWCVATTASTSLNVLAKKLRVGSPSVFARISKDRLVFDLRSVFAHQDRTLASALEAACKSKTAPSSDEGENETPDSAL